MRRLPTCFHNLLLTIGLLHGTQLCAQATHTCGGFLLTDSDSVQLLDTSAAVVFDLATGSYPFTRTMAVGPRVLVSDPAGLRIVDRSGAVRGGLIAKLGGYQSVEFGEDVIAVTDDDRTRIFDLDGQQQGQDIQWTTSTRQRVKIGSERVAVVEGDRVRIYDKHGQLVATVGKSGSNQQTVVASKDRIVVIDDAEVRIFDKDGNQKGNDIDKAGANRQAVKIDGDRIVVIDDTQVRIFDKDGAFQGAPIGKTGTARQQVILCGDRVIVVDDDRVRVFDRNGGAVGGPVVAPSGSSRPRVKTTKDRIVITDDFGTQVFDKDMNPQGQPIARTLLDAQLVEASDAAICVIDQDRVRIYDPFGNQQGAAILQTGWDTQRVRTEGDRVLVTDTDQVRVFDVAGQPVGAAIPVTQVEEYDVLLFAQCFTIVDDFSTVTIYDRDGNALGAPIAVGYGVQHVQATDDRVLVIDDDTVRLFDLAGAQLGATVTTDGEPEVQPFCWIAAGFENVGVGCGGASQLAVGGPWTGGVAQYQLFGPDSALGVLAVGFEDLPAPVDLGFLGAPGCVLYSDYGATYALLTDGEGFGSVDLQMPNDEAFLGARFTTQFVALDALANQLGLVTSDGVVTTFGQGI